MENSDKLITIQLDHVGLSIMRDAALRALQVDGNKDFAAMYDELLRIEKQFYSEEEETVVDAEE